MPTFRRPDRWAVAALCVLVIWLFREFLFEGGVFFRRDIHLVWHPQVEGFVRTVLAGSWPLWDPSPSFGQPLLADPGAEVLYPLTWLNLILRPWIYYTVFAFSHVLLASLGLYALARHWRLSRPAALVAAGLWTVSGPLLSCLDLWHHLASACWIPIVFLAGDVAFETGRAKQGLWLGLAFAAQILAGSADMCALTLLALSAWVLVAHVRWRRELWAANRKLVLTAALAATVAASLSAGVWAPALDVLLRSDRSHFPLEVRSYWSVHPLGLLEILIPGLWSGLPLAPGWRARLFESREPLLASLYLGLPALGLVAAAVSASSHRARRFLVTLGLAAVLVALGRHGPFYNLLVLLVPPLRILRYPMKAMILASFSWCLLGGLGFEVWRARDVVSRRRWVWSVTLPAVALLLVTAGVAVSARYFPGVWQAATVVEAVPSAAAALFRPAVRFAIAASLAAVLVLLTLARLRLGHPAIAVAIGVLAVGDLAAFHRHPSLAAPRELYTVRPPVLAALGDLGKTRVYSYDYSVAGKSQHYLGRSYAHVLRRMPEGWSPEASSALGMQMSLVPQTAGRWGIRQSFEVDYRGLFPAPLSQLTLFLRGTEETPFHLRLLRMGAVTHVIALHSRGLEDLRLVQTVPSLFDDPIRVYAVPDTLPRTYVVGASRGVDGSAAFGALVDPTFDPAREVVLSPGPSSAAPPSFSGRSWIVEERPDHLRIEAEATAPGWVVLADTFDPGWKATVDGRPSPVLRANVAFRAVAVAGGRHVVEYAYRPLAALLGLGLSGLSLLTIATALGCRWLLARVGWTAGP